MRVNEVGEKRNERLTPELQVNKRVRKVEPMSSKSRMRIELKIVIFNSVV